MYTVLVFPGISNKPKINQLIEKPAFFRTVDAPPIPPALEMGKKRITGCFFQP
jgi:hypothetical protein